MNNRERKDSTPAALMAVMKSLFAGASSGIALLLAALACAALALQAAPASSEEIRSRAAVVMDATNGRVLYAKNPELRLMPASTTKLMTGLVVVERGNLQDIVTISYRAASAAPTRSGLKAGDRVTVETLLYAALMRSANDAAVALAEYVAGSEAEFVGMMNRKAIALGANDTRFINANGLPGGGQYTTAYDLAKIMRQAIKHPVLQEILATRITEVSTEQGKTVFLKNTNRLLWADDEVLGGKTGYTNQARHCFVCAGERNDSTLIVSLLGSPSRDLLWKETEQLFSFGNRVLMNDADPVVYLTKEDYSRPAPAKKSHVAKAKARKKAKNSAVKAVKKTKPQAAAKKKSVNTKKVAKKAPAAKVPSKKKTTGQTDVARKENRGTEG